MSSITEILRKQADAVKAGSKVQQAEQLEALAKQLRAEAKQPVKFNFKAEAREKKEKAERFAAAIGADKLKRAQQLLLSKGWYLAPQNPDPKERVWINKDKPGERILLSSATYRAFYHQAQRQEKADLGFLGDYLNALK